MKKKLLLFALVALALIFSSSTVVAQDSAAPPGVSMIAAAQAGQVAQAPAADPDRVVGVLGIIFLSILVIEQTVTFIRSLPLLNKQVNRGKARKAKSEIAASPKRKKAAAGKKRSGPKRSHDIGPSSEAAPAGAATI